MSTVRIKSKQTGEYNTATYATTGGGNKRYHIDGKPVSDIMLDKKWEIIPSTESFTITRVLFLLEKGSPDEVFAVLIDNIENSQYVIYSHIGQHSLAALQYIKECRHATEEQYTPLMKELADIGYTAIEVVRRWKR